MAKTLTSDRLINSIKRRAMIPTDQDTFNNEDFLDMLNEEIQYFGVPHLLRKYEEYLVVHEDFPLEADKTEYEIPSRAIGNKLRGLYFFDDDNGQFSSDDNVYALHRISLEDLPEYTNDNNTFSNGFASVFYIKDNKVVLTDSAPFSDGTLRMYYYLKPNELVEEKKAGVISTIDTVAGIVTLSNFPEGFSNIPQIDFVQAGAPNQILKFDITPVSVNVSTKSITFNTSDLPENLKPGDYVNFAGEAIVPQLPTELHPVMAQRVAVAALEALGDQEGMARAQQRLQMMETSVDTIIDNRVESSNEKIRKRNGPLQEATWGNYYRGRSGQY